MAAIKYFKYLAGSSDCDTAITIATTTSDIIILLTSKIQSIADE